jgi:hypothetical protein
MLMRGLQRQTVVSQFFQLDKLVVEGGKTGKQTGSDNDRTKGNTPASSSRGSILISYSWD